MPKRCKFDDSKKCGYSNGYCQKCDVRLKLGQKMLVPEPQKPQTTTTTTVDDMVCCPYCLFKGHFSQFYTKTRHGISEKRFKCPDCGQGMMRDTLTKKMSTEEYAQWMFDTKAWERVRFGVWKQRLNDYGISFEFWTAYKKHKGEMRETESYEDYIERKQKEEYEEGVNMYDEEEY